MSERRNESSAATVEFEERHAHHEEAVRHVIADSPGTPETVKGYLRTALRGF